MTYNNLPPQAYTKDDVARAYVWVQTQPDYVKNMATSKEALVALYLQSRRNGHLTIEKMAPVSSKDFQSQLKNLASELSQFENEKKDTKTTIPVVSKPLNPQPTQQKNSMPTTPQAEDLLSESSPQAIEVQQQPPLPAQDSLTLQKTFQEFKSRPQSYENPLPTNTSKKTFQFQIDPRSEQIIRSVKAQLNMESEHDIIRMLLVLGFDRIKSLFPNNK